MPDQLPRYTPLAAYHRIAFCRLAVVAARCPGAKRCLLSYLIQQLNMLVSCRLQEELAYAMGKAQQQVVDRSIRQQIFLNSLVRLTDA